MYACVYVRTYIHSFMWLLLSKSAMVDGGLLLSNLQVAEEVANTPHDLGKDCEEMLPKRSAGRGGRFRWRVKSPSAGSRGGS